MQLKKEISCSNAAELAATDNNAFCLLRRNGFGASDSATLLGVSPFTKLEELIVQKQSTVVTPEELEVGLKPQVRKGADLECIVLDKFIKWFDNPQFQISKPAEQFKLFDDSGYTGLTINYDALIGNSIPVECKVCSPFGRKHWDFTKSLVNNQSPFAAQSYGSAVNIQQKINMQAEMIGIPQYYYTQVQQQLLGTPSTIAYLAVIDDKLWEFHVFGINQDEVIQEALIEEAKRCSLWDA